MKEFMFYIRNEKDAKKSLTGDKHLAFIKACESYIGVLKSANRLIAAQPLVREGIVLSKAGNAWKEREIGGDGEVQVGYYHILANDMQEAVSIAKDNPEFAYVESASIEIRAVKMKEEETAFVYPTQRG